MRCGCLTCALRRLVAFIKIIDKPDSPGYRHADTFMWQILLFSSWVRAYRFECGLHMHIQKQEHAFGIAGSLSAWQSVQKVAQRPY